MRNLLKQNCFVICCWMAVIAASAVATLIARGTQLQQLTIGLLCASVALSIALALFEIIWSSAVHILEDERDSEPGRMPRKG
jgi:uncharacterized membrane-anchored protein